MTVWSVQKYKCLLTILMFNVLCICVIYSPQLLGSIMFNYFTYVVYINCTILHTKMHSENDKRFGFWQHVWNRNLWLKNLGFNYTVLYCTVLYCTVLYCTVLYCTVLYCTATRSALAPPMFVYKYGYSFILMLLSFLLSEIAGKQSSLFPEIN